MHIDPITNLIVLENSNPEFIISGKPSQFLYREGDMFYIIDDVLGINRINVLKKAIAYKHRNQLWYESVLERRITFAHPYEIWRKVSGVNTPTGWQFVCFCKYDVFVGSEVIITTPTPT